MAKKKPKPLDIIFDALQGCGEFEDVELRKASRSIAFKHEGQDAYGNYVLYHYNISESMLEPVAAETIPEYEADLDALLDFECPDCKEVYPGREQCRNTGKCFKCSNNYEPLRQSDV